MDKKVLITGATGLVGSRIALVLSKTYHILTPSHPEFDVTNKNQVFRYVLKHKPHVIIHCAALLDLNEAERERGNKKGMYWMVNVEGTRNVSDVAKKIGSFVIHLSTGSVFHGSELDPGPYTEDHPVASLDQNSWYGWTKVQSERYVDGTVLRISHPIKRYGPRVKEDYLHAIIELHKKGQLYPMFIDQHIQLTLIDDIARVIEKLIAKPEKGIFHVTNPDWITPFELAQYILRDSFIQKGSIDDILKTHDIPRRFHKYSLLDVRMSQEKLGMRFKTWKEAVDDAYSSS